MADPLSDADMVAEVRKAIQAVHSKRVERYTLPNGQSVTERSLQQWQQHLQWLERRIEAKKPKASIFRKANMRFD